MIRLENQQLKVFQSRGALVHRFVQISIHAKSMPFIWVVLKHSRNSRESAANVASIFALVDIYSNGAVTFSVAAVIPDFEALFWHWRKRFLLLIRQHSEAGLRGMHHSQKRKRPVTVFSVVIMMEMKPFLQQRTLHRRAFN